MDRSRRRIVLKARQVGVSNVISIEALQDALTYNDGINLFVSRTQRMAQQLITYCQQTLTSNPELPRPSRSTQSEIEFSNGSSIISLPATRNAGRGFPARRVYLDEFAFADYGESIYESIIGTLVPGGQLTVLSTPNGRANMYFRLWNGLEGKVSTINTAPPPDDTGIWSRHLIHWSDCPRYNQAWAAEIQQTMTRESWAQEYDCSFRSSLDAPFETDDIARAQIGHNPSLEGIERYVTAWDIGRRHDYTVGITLGERRERRGDTVVGVWHIVAFERFMGPYPLIQSRIEARKKAFPGDHWVETNGTGDTVVENLLVKVSPFITTQKSKVQAIQALQQLLQNGRFKFNPKLKRLLETEHLERELNLYQWDDDDIITDTVMASAIAAVAVCNPRPRIRPL